MDRELIDQQKLGPGVRVVIQAFDDIPEHMFLIDEVYEDCVGGYSLNGPLAGEYGEPEFDLILRVVD
ncbi:hypothetical protein DSM110093_02813 [Sulfitobacter sp. DSM 110093]|uniref:hypothetical protein n=1 Tax=Sulfitobacter sp. DSM 110093 TaxID=2883127 RepID=UPI001FAC1F00|nr:hypothetical protein [Sulfitobacter sp. DSM 110093]UOA33003.1 hypothetical protein DSM110093_02813 [Sulfitobacter sp. DSM 110093]